MDSTATGPRSALPTMPISPVFASIISVNLSMRVAVDSIARHKAVYLMAVGGAAYLVSKAIRKSRTVAFEDLGMEAIYEFEVKDMPVTVAVDAHGESVHQTGPAEWRNRIAGIPVEVA